MSDDTPKDKTPKDAPEQDGATTPASGDSDIPQPVFKNTSTDAPMGEIPDPVFDDRPIVARGGEIPDPVFDEEEKPKKRELTQKELAELAATLPSDIRLDDNAEPAAPRPARPRKEPVNPFLNTDRGDAAPEQPALEQATLEQATGAQDTADPAPKAAPARDEQVIEDSFIRAMREQEASLEIKTDILKRDQYSELTDKDPALKKVLVGAGWDMRNLDGAPLDLDLSCFILDKKDMTRLDSDFVFYNNPNGAELAVKHSGDNRTGEGAGDDEVITIDLDALPYDIYKIVFAVTIYQGDEHELSFGLVKNAFIRIVNQDTKVELARFDLSNDFSEGTCLKFGELTREGTRWRFHAIGETFSGGLSKIAQEYGLLIAGT